MATINVDVGLNASKFTRGLDQMRSQLTSFGGAIKTIGSLAAVGAGMSFLKGMVDDIAKLKDQSDQLGMSVEAVQKLAFAFAQGGASQEIFVKGATKLSEVMQEARDGSASAAEKFTRLGISLDEVKSLDTEAMFLRLADAIAKGEDPVAALARATDILGKSGAKLVPVLKEGSAAMQEYMKGAAVVTTAQAGAIEAAAQRLENAWTNTKGKIAAGASRGVEAGGLKGLVVGLGGVAAGVSDSLFGTELTRDKLAEAQLEQDRAAAAAAAKDAAALAAKMNGPVAPSEDQWKEMQSAEEERQRTLSETEKLAVAAADRETAAIRATLEAKKELLQVGEDAEAQMSRLVSEFSELMQFAESHKDSPALAAEAVAKATKLQAEIARLGIASTQDYETSALTRNSNTPRVIADSMQEVGGGGNSAVFGSNIDTMIRQQANDIQAIRSLLANGLKTGRLNKSSNRSPFKEIK